MLKKFLSLFIITFILFYNESVCYTSVDIKYEGFQKIDTSSYYFGKIEETTYFLKFDYSSYNKASGYFFKVDGDLYAKKIPFELKKKSKKIYIKTDIDEFAIKTDLKFTYDSIFGKYAVKEKVFLFLKKFKWHEDICLKKYSAPEFKKFRDLYNSKVFNDIVIKNNVIYGSARGYWDSYITESESYASILQRGISSSILKKNLVLKMDVYMPKDDTSKLRPFIMFIHGGGFYIGDKQDKSIVEWCKYFASLGYVTASINYRLGFKPSGTSLERAGYRALQDAHAAMRYIVDNLDYYGIDANNLFVAGTSAGAVTSLNLTYMRNINRPKSCFGNLITDDLGNIESSTNDIKTKFNIKAIANMWGAVNDLKVLDNAKTPIISFHSKGDRIVPIDNNYPFNDIKGNLTSYILNKVYGSRSIHKRAKELGIKEILHEFNGDRHEIHVDDNNNLSSNYYFITEKIKSFFYKEIIKEPCKIISIPNLPYKSAMSKYTTNNKEYSKLYWKIEGGIILTTTENIVNVIWFKDSAVHKLTISGYYNNGASFYDEYEF